MNWKEVFFSLTFICYTTSFNEHSDQNYSEGCYALASQSTSLNDKGHDAVRA